MLFWDLLAIFKADKGEPIMCGKNFGWFQIRSSFGNN